MQDTLTIKVGDTVTFTNLSEEAPHTITMNEPDTFNPTQPDNLDAAGHATINSPQDRVNSGFLWLHPFFPPVVGTKFQITFTQPGTYNYYCDLHDVLGMTAKINVTPKS